ncbi:MAG: cytochrome c-type biogenesis protein CcmH [Planctomycetota bacterium]|nr:cytochrome c-type biogenesis protein CcmH [Planctomycetota bacterium]
MIPRSILLWASLLALAATTTSCGGEQGPQDRYTELTQLLACACPKENFTRTLRGCPDTCADPQKEMIKTMLDDGKTNDEILQYMVAQYRTPKVLATAPFAGIHLLAYLFPVAFMLAGGYVIFSYLRARTDRRASPPEGSPGGDDDAWEKKIEAELKEL